ncbi:WD domain-containing protein [Apiospora phragmitis]|uniref:WD domain-containing protein n=1 Tax=Apiospora phragmitis TaxID=2905665 RepID=A0ABR1SWL1_9PEZI
MTDESPKAGKSKRINYQSDDSDSGPELAKIDPRPVEEEDDDDDDAPMTESDRHQIPGDHGADKPVADVSEDDEDGEDVAEYDEDGEEVEEESDDDEEDEEPKLKYARLTQHLNAVYRNGDMTSAFLVAGDKMLIGTHNGNMVASRAVSQATAGRRAPSQHSERATTSGGSQRRPRDSVQQLPNIPSNNIFIATSSMDGNVCVQSLIDMTDVSLRNFARPVQAVALSPDYKNDRTYVSGGKAGSLVLTMNPPRARSKSTTVGTAAATASGWLGSVGLGTNTGKDTVLHSGEGTISNIKWSLSGKYLAWLNEHGIKIMRTKMHLDSADSEDAWKRVGHVDRPQTDEWEEMAGVWKGRAEWIDEQAVENDEDGKEPESPTASSAAANKLKQTASKASKNIERLLVGWGGTIWIIHIHPGRMGIGKYAGERSVGHAEIAKKLRMDCIISDQDEEEDDVKKHVKGHQANLSTASGGSEPSGGRRRRQNALAPELRLIDLQSQAEVDKDSLTVSQFGSLSSNDYHLGVLPAGNAASVVASRGVLDAMAGFGSEMWNAAINPRSLFSSGASIRSNPSNDNASGTQAASTIGSGRARTMPQTVHPNLVKPGAKIFIHSPFDCILATKRDLGDHLEWLLQQQRYEDAWSLLDDHPEIMVTSPEAAPEFSLPTPERKSTSDDFFEETSSVIESQFRAQNSSAEKEKRRIGELWLQEIVEARDWTQAGKVAAKVLSTADGWEKWIFNFAGAKKFDEIVNFIPSEPMRPPIPGTAYEIILGHYIQNDKPHFKELLDRWNPDLFDIPTIATALENQLRYRDVREDSVEDGEKGRDWRIVMESLAHLQELNGRHREALRHYIKLQDADSVMRLIRDNHLADAVTDDVPSFIALRVPESQLSQMTLSEIDEATSEAITLLVDEAQRGLIKPDIVVQQLEKKKLNRYLYFYLRGLWKAYRERPVDEAISLIDDFADLAVQLFAEFDRVLLMDFLKVSTSYTFEKADQECESHNYVPELVYLYSKTGQMKRALYLIIDRLADVSQAIAFAKEQGDPDLWEDLLNYSMDKPQFIQGLLEEVGTSIDPITLVRRIPEGLEIPGLREGLKHIMKEHEIQYSISSGVARVLRSEVAAAQNMLRMGQRKGIKFEVMVKTQDHVDVEVKEVATLAPNRNRLAGDVSGTETPTASDAVEAALETHQPEHDHRAAKPGHCSRCHEPFHEFEVETLVGFACGHVFHVSHLLEQLRPGETPDPGLVGHGDEEDRTSHGRFVRRKVTHARLLRDKIEAGCPVCSDQREAVEGMVGA